MSRQRSLFAAILASASLVLGCSDGPALAGIDAPQLAVTSTGWLEFNFTSNDNCNGELVDWTTLRKFVFTTTFDAAGGGHVGVHRTWRGTGVGQVTGTAYILNWPNEIQQSFSAVPFTATQRIANNLVTKGNRDNRIFSLTRHITVNANGEVTVDFSKLTLTCQG